MVMRKHQRYFPVYGTDGGLLPVFITVANGDVDAATVRVRGDPWQARNRRAAEPAVIPGSATLLCATWCAIKGPR